MVKGGNQTFCGGHFAVHTYIKSLWCTPEMNILLLYILEYISYMGFPGSSAGKESSCNMEETPLTMQETWFDSWVGKKRQAS